jgi:hypothetical protein
MGKAFDSSFFFIQRRYFKEHNSRGKIILAGAKRHVKSIPCISGGSLQT